MSTNAEVVLDVFRAIEERDQERLYALWHDEVELREPASLPYGGTRRGKELMREQLESSPEETWLGTWGPLQPTEAERRMDPRVLGESGDEVVVAYRQRGVSPGGERFEEPIVGVYEVRDGKFARGEMFHYDTAALIGFLARATG